MPSFIRPGNLPNRASKIKCLLARHDIHLPRASVKGPVIINGRGWDRREKGWVNKNLTVPKGGLRKNGIVVGVGNIFLA